MNLFNIFSITDNYYSIDDDRTFFVDKLLLKTNLKKIKYPAICFDFEFFNRSHDQWWKDMKRFYNETEKDIVFLIQYKIVYSYEDFQSEKYRSSIKKIVVKRSKDDKKYNFRKLYDNLVKQFLNLIIYKKIKTFICAGGATDFKIVNQWLDMNYSKTYQRTLPFIYEEKEDFHLRKFDVYEQLLMNCFDFENKDEKGNIFIENEKSIAKGGHDKQLIKLQSLLKFSNWIGQKYCKNIYNEKDNKIQDLCKYMLRFYGLKPDYNFSDDEYNIYRQIQNITIRHCWNDVYRMLLFLEFCQNFIKKIT